MEERRIRQYHAAIIGLGETIANRMQLQAHHRAIVLKAHELLAAQEVAEVSATPPEGPEDRWTRVHNSLIAEVFDKAVELLQTAEQHGVTHCGEGILRNTTANQAIFLKAQKEGTIGGVGTHPHRDITLPRGVAWFTVKNVLQEILGERYNQEFEPLYKELHGNLRSSIFNNAASSPN